MLGSDFYIGMSELIFGQLVTEDWLNDIVYHVRWARGELPSQAFTKLLVPLVVPAVEGSDTSTGLLLRAPAVESGDPDTGVLRLEAITEDDTFESAAAGEYGDALSLLFGIADDDTTAQTTARETLARLIVHRKGQNSGELCISVASDDGAGNPVLPTDPALEHLRISPGGAVSLLKFALAASVQVGGGTLTALDSGGADTIIGQVTLTTAREYLILVMGHIETTGGYFLFTQKIKDGGGSTIGYVQPIKQWYGIRFQFVGFVKHTVTAAPETISLTSARDSGTSSAKGYLIAI